MGKKHKSPSKNGNPSDDSKTNEGSNSSTLFTSLFGNINQNPESNSLFSENNPFRRKPLESRESNLEAGLGFAGKDFESGDTLGDPDFSETQQGRKRKKDKLENVSSNLDVELVELKGKKLKRGVNKGSGNNEINDSGFQSEEIMEKGDGQLPPSDAGSGGSGVGKEKKKKKRKRDEIEAEYEAKMYGVAQEVKENKQEGHGLGEKRKKMDNPEDMMVSKEGFDDESKLLRTVFVGNLPLKFKKKEIAKEFGKFGDVETVRIRSVPIVDGKIPRKGAVIKKQFNENVDSVHAYVVFKTEESAQASLAHNMAVVGGNHIRVDRACPPRKKLKGDNTPLYDYKRTVFVGNLPFDVKDEEIYKLFSGIKNLETSVEAIRVIRDPGSSLGKGIAYVLFKTVDATNLVVKKRNLKIRDRDLRLSHAKSTESLMKRKSTSQPEANNPPAKKFTSVSRTPESVNKVKANLSYQGLRACKSGAQKKVSSTTPHAKLKSKPRSRGQPSSEPKSRSVKRPAVAARKEKALRAASKTSPVAGSKRKLGSQTPQTGGQKKKARKFR